MYITGKIPQTGGSKAHILHQTLHPPAYVHIVTDTILIFE